MTETHFSMPVRAENASDSDLVAAIRKSEAGAFKLLYFRYYEMLFTFLWRRTRERETAQDLVQELFARVWQQREKLAPAPSLKPYLYRIAHHLAIDHLRKKKSPAPVSMRSASRPLISPTSCLICRTGWRRRCNGYRKPCTRFFI